MIMKQQRRSLAGRKIKADRLNLRVQEWGKTDCGNISRPLPHADQGEKWMLMTKIFDYERRAYPASRMNA